MSKRHQATKQQIIEAIEEHEHSHQHQARVKRFKRMLFWAVVAGLIVLTSSELATKVIEFIAGSLLDMVIQWE